MPKGRGSNLKDRELYEELREDGASKEKAARISNAAASQGRKKVGSRGAIALTAEGERASVAALPVDVIDANGAGDAFFAGFLAARLAGAELNGCLDAGSRQAVVALSSEHLHPAVVAG